MAAGNTNYTNLTATTLANFANDIFDNVIINNPTLNELKKAGNIKVVTGGTKFSHPLLYTSNTTFGAINKYGTIATDLQDPITRAEYNIKVLAGSVVYSLIDEAMNAGDKEKLIDYVESIKLQADTTMINLMGSQVMKAETAVSSGTDFDSLPYIISSAASGGTNSIGGIDSTANSYWRPYRTATTITAFTASSEGLKAFDLALNSATFGTQGPTFMITTKTVFGLYMVTLSANVRYTTMDSGDGAFRKLLYCTLPLYMDDNCPTGMIYFVDGKSLKLQVLAQANMKLTAMTQAYNQLMARSILYLAGNLTCGSRRTCGSLYCTG